MKPSTLFCCATALAACVNVSPPSPVEAARLTEARQLLSENPDGALSITDKLLASNPDLLEARILAAQGLRMLAVQPGRGRGDLLLHDAVTNLEHVVNATAEPVPETWRLLANCRFDLALFEGATDAALRAAEGFHEREGDSAQANVAESMLLAANASLRSFVAARQIEIDNGEENKRGIVPPSTELAQQALIIARRFETVREEYPAEATTQTALLWQWLGQDQAAIAEFERGIANHPEQGSIHDAYLRSMATMGQYQAACGAYSRFVRADTDAVILLWYQGKALYVLADDQRRQGNFQGAIASYDKAKGAFGEYSAMVPAHSDSANHWLALCHLSIARASVELGDYNSARQQLFAADTASPMATAYENGLPQLRDTFGSHYTGVVFAMHVALTESSESALQRTLEFNEAIFKRHPDRWGFVYNNAALAARDLGVQVETDGDSALAMELWERSYAYYEKAVVLSPDDARIVNDCGLMLIYHLNRNFDRAKECFDQAIDLGQAQLDEMSEDTDPRERELLEEAVGDAWQNIAWLMEKHLGSSFEEYKEFCQKAVRFFPYGRREAAAMLRRGGTDGKASKGPGPNAQHLDATSSDQQDQGGATEAFKKVKDTAREKADSGDLDGALSVLDKIAKDCKDHAPYLSMCGELNYALAIVSRDAGRTGTEFFFADAITSLTRAVSLNADPIGPRLLLAKAQYETSDFIAAEKSATSLLSHMQSQSNCTEEDIAATHTVRANAAARAYAKDKADDKDNPGLLTSARASFRFLERGGLLEVPLVELWSVTELWAKAPVEAVNVLARAVQRTPEDQALLGKLVDTGAAQDQLDIAIKTLAGRQDATALWYLGKARYMLAGRERERAKIDDALKTLDKSAKDFRSSMAKNAAYGPSCERWIAMCLGKKGNIAYFRDDLDRAQEWLLEAVRTCPEGLTDDLGLSESTKMGILRLADKHRRQGDLGKVEAIYRVASDAADTDLDMLNNAGLFARDHGDELEREGKTKDAMEMFEQSYKAYRRAQELDPTSVRLRNDCALIAIYHLERDWDEMKKLLEAAAADGEEMLKSNPPESDDERRNLDEAVGDCYENLALWHLKHTKNATAAKAAAIRSQKHYPGEERRGARRHLEAAERMLQDK